MTSKNLFWIRALKITAIIVPCILIVLFLPITASDDARTVHDFYLEEADSLDVIIFGASDVYAGYSAPLAYEEFGFTSYPYVFSYNQIDYLPFQMEDVFQTQSPEFIVIELTESYLPVTHRRDLLLREYLVSLPSLDRKRDWIEAFGESEGKLSYYLPFSLYHGTVDLETMFKNIQREYMVHSRGYSLLKNNLIYTVPPSETISVINPTGDISQIPLPAETEQNFINLLNYCQNHIDVPILFVTFPHKIATEKLYQVHQYANSVGDLIRSYGYDYINFGLFFDQIGLDTTRDYYDNEHMNLYGQYKMTRYLSNILVNEYGVSGRELTPLSKERWNTCVEYQHLYRQLFDDLFQKDGVWLCEDAWLLNELEQMRATP